MGFRNLQEKLKKFFLSWALRKRYTKVKDGLSEEKKSGGHLIYRKLFGPVTFHLTKKSTTHVGRQWKVYKNL